MKTLEEIWNEYEEPGIIGEENKKALIWHLEHDEDPADAITLATDMGLKQLGPYLAKFLDHEDDWIRELTVGCVLGRLRLPEYAENGLEMAQNDPFNNVRNLAIMSVGAVLNQVNNNLQHEIACYLYKVLMTSEHSNLYKQAAYDSVLNAMEVPITLWPPKKLKPQFEQMVDLHLLHQFKEKYLNS